MFSFLQPIVSIYKTNVGYLNRSYKKSLKNCSRNQFSINIGKYVLHAIFHNCNIFFNILEDKQAQLI